MKVVMLSWIEVCDVCGSLSVRQFVLNSTRMICINRALKAWPVPCSNNESHGRGALRDGRCTLKDTWVGTWESSENLNSRIVWNHGYVTITWSPRHIIGLFGTCEFWISAHVVSPVTFKSESTPVHYQFIMVWSRSGGSYSRDSAIGRWWRTSRLDQETKEVWDKLW